MADFKHKEIRALNRPLLAAVEFWFADSLYYGYAQLMHDGDSDDQECDLYLV
jgi:hypothetical protein